MGSPYHIDGTTSRLFPDRSSAQYAALSHITKSFAHPQRTFLAVFLQKAFSPEYASQFFLDQVVGKDQVVISEFLADWTALVRKVKPLLCKGLDEHLKRQILDRDSGQCCVSQIRVYDEHDPCPSIACILPPPLCEILESNENARFRRLLKAYVGEATLQELTLLACQSRQSAPHYAPNQFITFSPQIFDHFANGRLSLQKGQFQTSTSARYLVQTNQLISSKQVETFHFLTLENKSVESVNLPDTLYLETHNRFAEALAWLEVLDYMKTPDRIKQRSEPQNTPLFDARRRTRNSKSWFNSVVMIVLRSLWTCAPLSFRAWAYEKMASVSIKTYGYTGSDSVFRLPFNLYLRKAGIRWAAKHRAEFETLRLLDTHTQVPAPRGLDVIQYRDNSFLLMTGVHGEGLGRRLATLTDSQVNLIVLDLQQYAAELRSIPRKISSDFQICNSLGSGILDWRIGNSRRELLRFQSEEAFHRYLTNGIALAAEDKAIMRKAHSIEHKIVFTHADINMRNVLVDENGRIPGIVDWECAGWYPEYWEYTKMHFGARVTARWIADVIDQIFTGYREELRAEDILAAIVPPW